MISLQWIALSLLAFAWLLLFTLRRRKPRKTEAYACGESIPSQKVPSKNIYLAFRSVLPRTYRWLDRLHNEKLTDYMTTILFVLSMLLLMVMLLWIQ